ncbi:MAG: ABC transporter ATP-binding protein [Acidimicrobiia bacterium]|nr:ABC transporter ATP-binding protein [Acidimicrobiia bacterium]MYB43711.1 ABC transporter ATP-binding protein [Acidimicrobiia bacterium]MYC86415.1 ABC transporter ATP-binding protein [Acidimicrobiia bacterium]
MSRVVSFEGLWCVFEHRSGQLVNALHDVNFEVQPGEFVCVVGRSGHGKTTLLRVLAGLQPPTAGQTRLGEQVVEGPGADRAMVFQQDTVFPWLHVRENVEFGLRALKVDDEERKRTTAHWLEAVGLTDFADSWPRELSGGMRKRVALASAMAVGSDVILMDEPFGSLDYFTRRNLHDVLLDLWEETQKTIFFVTHDIEEALILADRVILLAEGKLVDDIRVDLPRPRDEDVRASTGAVDITKTILAHLGITEEEATQV